MNSRTSSGGDGRYNDCYRKSLDGGPTALKRCRGVSPSHDSSSPVRYPPAKVVRSNAADRDRSGNTVLIYLL